jgi:hypothetical protein
MIYAEPFKTRVTGMWLEDGESFEAYVSGSWNGWAVPEFEREAAEAVCKAQARQSEQDGYDDAPTLTWDGDVIVFRDPNGMDGEELEDGIRIEANAEGRWQLDLGWTWELAEGAPDPERTTEAQAEAFKRLKASVEVWSENRVVMPDGSADFRILADLGHRTPAPRGTPVREHIGSVMIDTDGSVRVSTYDLVIRRMREIAAGARAMHNATADALEELADALDLGQRYEDRQQAEAEATEEAS